VVAGWSIAACEMWTVKPSIWRAAYWSVVSWMKGGGELDCCWAAQDARIMGASRRAIERDVRVGVGMSMGSVGDMC